MRNLNFTVARDITCSVCRGSKSEALSYGRGEKTPETLGEVIHTDIEGHLRPERHGMRNFIVFTNEGSRGKGVIALRTHEPAVEATGHYPGRILREGLSVEYISGDGAGELRRVGKFLKML